MLPFYSRGGPRRGGLRGGAPQNGGGEVTFCLHRQEKEKKNPSWWRKSLQIGWIGTANQMCQCPCVCPPRGGGGWGRPWKVANLRRESSSADQNATKRRSAG